MKDLVVISYDDSILGKYFEKCRNDLESYLKSMGLNPNIHCMHNSCDKDLIDETIKTLSDHYCVIVYAHGSKVAIEDQHGNILVHENDVAHYHNSIFYSTACYNAESLGGTLIRYMSKIFFGYKDYSWALDNDQGIVFIETDNFALKKILSGCINGQKIYEDTYDFFYKKYIELENSNFELAPLIYHNMDAMRVYEYPNKEYY